VQLAKRKLLQLEHNQVAQNTQQSDMFAAVEEPVAVVSHPIVAELEAIQPDDLTPKQALEFLYQLKKLLNE
jgi:DNA mismatch repair protein MutS